MNPILIIGDGPQVWWDIQRVPMFFDKEGNWERLWANMREFFDQSPLDIMTTGAMAFHWPWRLDHHATMNHLSVAAIRLQRASYRWSLDFLAHVPIPPFGKPRPVIPYSVAPHSDYVRWHDPHANGSYDWSSGAFGVWVAGQLEYTEIYVAGMPMNQEVGHFYRPPWASKPDGSTGRYALPAEVKAMLPTIKTVYGQPWAPALA